jgi:hypothetical protein
MGSAQILEKKKKTVDGLADIFNSSGVYLFDYRGLKVSEMGNLRNRIKALGANLKVVKNRLALKFFVQRPDRRGLQQREIRRDGQGPGRFREREQEDHDQVRFH